MVDVGPVVIVPNSIRPGFLPAGLSVEEENIGLDTLSEGRLRVLLRKMKYRYRRPKHDLHHLQDPEAKEQARELLEELKKGASKTISNSSLWTKQP